MSIPYSFDQQNINAAPLIILQALVNSSAFAVLALVVSVGFIIKEYIGTLFETVDKFPRIIATIYLGFGYLVVVLFFVMAYTIEPVDELQHVMRASFAFGGTTMLFGPQLLFTPMKPIKLKKETLAKKIVVASQSKASRYIALFAFFLLTAVNGFVAAALWVVLGSLGLELTQLLAVVLTYVFIVLFYLVSFWNTMTQKPLVIKGIDIIGVIRDHISIVINKKKHLVLAMRGFVGIYLFVFLMNVLAGGALCGYLFYLQVNSWDLVSSSGDPLWSIASKVIVCIFFAMDIILLIACSIFVLNVAFKPIPSVTVDLGKGQLMKLREIMGFGVAGRERRKLIYCQSLSDLRSQSSWENYLEKQVQHCDNSEGFFRVSGSEFDQNKIFQQNDSDYMFFVETVKTMPNSKGFYFILRIQEHASSYNGDEERNEFTNHIDPLVQEFGSAIDSGSFKNDAEEYYTSNFPSLSEDEFFAITKEKIPIADSDQSSDDDEEPDRIVEEQRHSKPEKEKQKEKDKDSIPLEDIKSSSSKRKQVARNRSKKDQSSKSSSGDDKSKNGKVGKKDVSSGDSENRKKSEDRMEGGMEEDDLAKRPSDERERANTGSATFKPIEISTTSNSSVVNNGPTSNSSVVNNGPTSKTTTSTTTSTTTPVSTESKAKLSSDANFDGFTFDAKSNNINNNNNNNNVTNIDLIVPEASPQVQQNQRIQQQQQQQVPQLQKQQMPAPRRDQKEMLEAKKEVPSKKEEPKEDLLETIKGGKNLKKSESKDEKNEEAKEEKEKDGKDEKKKKEKAPARPLPAPESAGKAAPAKVAQSSSKLRPPPSPISPNKSSSIGAPGSPPPSSGPAPPPPMSAGPPPPRPSAAGPPPPISAGPPPPPPASSEPSPPPPMFPTSSSYSSSSMSGPTSPIPVQISVPISSGAAAAAPRRNEMEKLEFFNDEQEQPSETALNLDDLLENEEKSERLRSSSSPLQIGAELGRSFGIVYKATFNSQSAVVRDFNSLGKSDRDFFLAQTVQLHHLNSHKNIVEILEIMDKQLQLVSEFISNGTLAAYISTHSKIDSNIQNKFILGIAEGMQHLHSSGIIHGNLTSRNVLLTNDLEPKISDFGIVEKAPSTSTRWLSPESLSKGERSTKSDVWSFGCVVVHILTSKEPYDGFSISDVSNRVPLGSLTPMIPPNISQNISSILVLIFSTQPSSRPDFSNIIYQIEGNSLF